MITIIPLSITTSRIAQPTPPSSTTSNLNAEVANSNLNIRRSSILIKDNSLSPPSGASGSVSGSGRKGSTTSSLGKHSLSKEDLKNLELNSLTSTSGGGISKKRIVKAAMGMVRGKQCMSLLDFPPSLSD